MQVRKVLAVLLLSAGALGAAAQSVSADDFFTKSDSTDSKLFSRPLFSDSPFKDDDIASQLDADVTTAPSKPNAQRQVTGATVDAKIARSQIDQQMRSQMSRVANWLKYYLVRNQNRFPGYVNSADELYSAQVQLSELVPNNPYAYGPVEGLNFGIPANYNNNGSPATGSPVWGDQWTEHLQAQTNNRVQLQVNESLTPEQINEWAKNPPAEWTAAPGTITAIGNNNGIYIVWGADGNGQPIKNPMNGLTYIIAGTTSGTVNDQAAPNEI